MKTAEINKLRKQVSGLLSKAEEQEFHRLHQKLFTPLNLYSVDLLKDAFAFANHHRDERSPANNIAVRSIVAVLDHLFDSFDRAGLDEYVRAVAPKFEKFNFEDFSFILADEIRLAHQASVFYQEFAGVFSLAEKNKSEFLAECENGTFRFSSIQLSSIPAYLGPGSSWGEFFGTVLGAVAIAINVAAEIPTVGLATASIVAGVAGVGKGAVAIIEH
jgi:hypothetical protein